jgi:hypothetical protein
MMPRNLVVRRLLAARLNHAKSLRSYHASAKLGADALDMVDTFARRHSEFLVIYLLDSLVICFLGWTLLASSVMLGVI